jgi:hypothetical protein
MQTLLTQDDSLRWTESVRGSEAERDAGGTGRDLVTDRDPGCAAPTTDRTEVAG